MTANRRKSFITKDFGVDYRELVYSIWYTNKRPSMNALYDMLPKDSEGDVPKPVTLNTWRKNYNWDDRANSTDIKVIEKTDKELVKVRLDMMRRHAKQAQQIAETAYDFLIDKDGGFDSSASAVTAWKVAVEEEKRSTGLANSLTQILSMSDDDLKKRLGNYWNRLENIGELSKDDEDVIDAFSTEETSDNG